MPKKYETIIVEREGKVDWLTLNRPHALNAINTQMVTDLRDYFGGLTAERAVRIIVMRGSGRSFCAGLDIKEFSKTSEQPFSGGMGLQSYLSDVYAMMRRCPQPIISLVQGAACGGGFSFALASDIRIAGESAKMNAAYIKVGLSACDMGASYFLPRLVGTSVSSELLLTGRFINAERCLQIGLVSEIVPDSKLPDAANTYIEEMLETSPMGLRLTKEGINIAIDSPSLDAAIAIENRNQLLCIRTADANEGLTAFVEKRRPVYHDK